MHLNSLIISYLHATCVPKCTSSDVYLNVHQLEADVYLIVHQMGLMCT